MIWEPIAALPFRFKSRVTFKFRQDNLTLRINLTHKALHDRNSELIMFYSIRHTIILINTIVWNCSQFIEYQKSLVRSCITTEIIAARTNKQLCSNTTNFVGNKRNKVCFEIQFVCSERCSFKLCHHIVLQRTQWLQQSSMSVTVIQAVLHKLYAGIPTDDILHTLLLNYITSHQTIIFLIWLLQFQITWFRKCIATLTFDTLIRGIVKIKM